MKVNSYSNNPPVIPSNQQIKKSDNVQTLKEQYLPQTHVFANKFVDKIKKNIGSLNQVKEEISTTNTFSFPTGKSQIPDIKTRVEFIEKKEIEKISPVQIKSVASTFTDQFKKLQEPTRDIEKEIFSSLKEKVNNARQEFQEIQNKVTTTVYKLQKGEKIEIEDLDDL